MNPVSLDEALNGAPCGFVAFADDTTVLSVNETLLLLLGRSRESVEGAPITTLLTVGSRIFCQTHLFPLLRMNGRVDEIYLALLTQSGDEVPVLINAVRRQRNGDAGNDVVLIPVRQRNQFEEELLRARETAEEATREKQKAYAELSQAHRNLEESNVELESQTVELQIQQQRLLEVNALLQVRVEREALLNHIGLSLRVRGDIEPGTILRDSVAALGQALGADRCYFAEYDSGVGQANVTADWRQAGIGSAITTSRVSKFDMDVARMYDGRGLLVASDIKGEEEGAHRLFSPKGIAALTAMEVRSLVSVALYESGVPVAALNVAMASTSRNWTAQEVELVQSVATLTRLAVEEARLREHSRRIAEQLQGALQPDVPRNVPDLKLTVYYQPALVEATVGGDFYDVFPLAADCYAVVVADLSGKGLQAAAQIAVVRHMLRTLLYTTGTTAADAVTTLNDMITQHELLTGFATLFVGIYDATERHLIYVNAGQEPGLLYRPTTKESLRLDPTGPVLGGFAGASFVERTLPLLSGDVLALFTDGLTEAGVDRKNLLEIDGLEEIFVASAGNESASVQDIANGVVGGVISAMTREGIRDDVCLLIARVD